MDDDVPNTNSTSWSGKDDALLFYITAISPFSDIRKNVKLLPCKTIDDMLSRINKIIDDTELQKRLLSEFNTDNFSDIALSLLETEKFFIKKIIRDNPIDIIKYLVNIPHLFSKIRSPESIENEILKVEMEIKYDIDDVNDENYYINEYLKFVRKINNKKLFGRYNIKYGYSHYLFEKLSFEPSKKSTSFRPKTCHTFRQAKSIANSIFQLSDLAALISYKTFHKISKTRVFIGRQSIVSKPDIDLSMYEMRTVSRNHCSITFCSDGRFYLKVIGRDVIINYVVFYRNKYIQLKSYDIIDVGGVPLMFIENPTFRRQVDELFEKNANQSPEKEDGE